MRPFQAAVLTHWPWAQIWVHYTEILPQPELVQSVHLVAVDQHGNVCVCRDDRGNYFLPGGTRERNESITDCLTREIREEAGLTMTQPPLWFGAHVGVGYRDRPYRPYLPHPTKAWLWGVAPVVIDSAPTNPAGAEQVREVLMLDLGGAEALLTQTHAWYAPLLKRASTRFGGHVNGSPSRSEPRRQDGD